MRSTEKTWVRITVALATPIILGLAFVYGQIYFLNRQSAASFTPISANNIASAKLVDLTDKGLVLIFKEKRFVVSPEEFKTWVEKYSRSFTGEQEYRINQQKITLYLENIAKEIDIAPTDARLSVNNGKITEFSTAQRGRLLNVSESRDNIISALTQNIDSSAKTPNGENTIELVIDEIEPRLALDKINDLGINTLLGHGESNFAGSPNSRIHNIGVGAKTFSGVLLGPGQEFSFNQTLGTVDASSGYLPELVIKGGKIIPEYGGGLCQVSTTLFRAAVASGLVILERHPHSIPVRYYNPQGFDAAIYPGISDLKFRNDTPAHILIQSSISGSKLYFEIYGISDGRKVTIDGPHQYDVKPNGAQKAVLTRTTTYADGTEKKDVFNSSYQSNSAFVTIKNPFE
jgi:vancomycin resistance protein YoaR